MTEIRERAPRLQSAADYARYARGTRRIGVYKDDHRRWACDPSGVRWITTFHETWDEAMQRARRIARQAEADWR